MVGTFTSRRRFLVGAAVASASWLAARPGLTTPISSFSGHNRAAPQSSPVVTMSSVSQHDPMRESLGAALRPEHLADDAFRKIVASTYGRITPEIHLKWDALEWRQGELNYAPVDQLLAFSEDNGLALRGHALLWERSTPPWAIEDMQDRRDWATVSGHFRRTLQRYGGKIIDWDVINEPIDTETGDDRGLRYTVFRKAFGPDYGRRAFEEARQWAPGTRLFVNDYGFEYANAVEGRRRRAFLTFLEGLQREGAPLGGVGLQAHLDLAKGPLAAREMRDFVRAIASMGLTIDVTELDVKEHDFGAPIAQRDQVVADEVRRFFDIMLTDRAIRTVTTWGVSDRYSWLSASEDGTNIPGKKAPTNRGLPFDTAYRPKPFFFALQRALDNGLRSDGLT